MILWLVGAHLQFPHSRQNLESRTVLQSLVGINIGDNRLVIQRRASLVLSGASWG